MRIANVIEVKVAKTDREFVGIKVSNNKVTITFPIGYEIVEETIKTSNREKIKKLYNDVKILMTTIEKSKNELYGTGYKEFNFSSAIFIIEDFIKNGLYNKPKNICQKNTNGKINWKRTILQMQPIYTKGNYIYLQTYNYNICETENKVTEIQKYCLSVSLQILGWLYNFNDIFNEHLHMNKREMIYVLMDELNQTNEDRKKKLLEQMILFINGTETSIIGEEEFEVGTLYFDKIWEGILRKQVYALYQEKNCYPTTYYYIDTKIVNSKLLPDITIQNDSRIVIIDAKYYTIGNLPESSDICKQLFYGQYIMHKNPKCKITNIFILPQNLQKNSADDKFINIGYANAEHLADKHRIYTYYLDVKSLLENQSTIKRLLKEIAATS